MADSVGQIGLDLVVNQNGFNKQMQGISGLAKKAGSALAGAFAVKKIVDFSAQCIELGSNLSEVQNVVESTFKTMSGKVNAFAANAINSFGLSETVAKKYMGTLGAMSRSMGFSENQAYDMSSAVTGLAGDVASFYNMSSDEAFTKLKSIWTGETESIKDLGVVMTQAALDQYALANGYGKTTSKMTEQEKVALRYQYVLNSLKTASGDFINTQDSWANQTRVLSLRFDAFKATIGQGLINALTPAVKFLNLLVSKLQVVADAFSNFTAMIFGKQVATASSAVADSVSDIGTAATDSVGSVGDAAKATTKAAKQAEKATMSFDGLNILQKNDSSDDSGSGTGGGAGGAGVSVSDTGGGATDAIASSTEEASKRITTALDVIKTRFNELAGLFKQGFVMGAGDLPFDQIKKDIVNIGKKLVGIFTDPEVVKSADGYADSLALSLGKITGSAVSIGTTFVSVLVGSISDYFDENSEYLKDKLEEMFDLSADTADIIGDFSVVMADIISVFNSDSTRQIGADLIDIIVTSALETTTLFQKIGNDLLDGILKPIKQNKGKIKESLSTVFAIASEVMGTEKTSVEKAFQSIQSSYDKYISPAISKISDGISSVYGSLLDAFNKYILPAFEGLQEKFDDFMVNYFDPLFQKFTDFVGKVVDGIATIWDKTLAPFISWLIDTFGPVIADNITYAGDVIFEFGKGVADIVSDIIDALGGVVDFVVGVLTGDWELAWTGIKEIFGGIWDAIVDLFKGAFAVIEEVFKPVGVFFEGVGREISDAFKDIGKWFSDRFEEAYEGVTDAFKDAGTFFKGCYTSITTALKDVGAWFKTQFDTAYKNVTTAFKDIGTWFGDKYTAVTTSFKNVGSWFKSQFDNAWGNIKTAFSGVSTWFQDKYNSITGIFSSIPKWFKDTFTEAWTNVKNVFSSGGKVFDGIKDGIADAFKSVVDTLIDGINTVIATPFNKINSMLNSIKDANILGVKPFSSLWSKNPISVPRIPYLAQGGYVKANTPQLAMIGDNRHEGEVVAPESKLEAMAAKAAQSTGGSTGEMIRLLKEILTYLKASAGDSILIMDSTEVARGVNRANDRILRRTYTVKPT